MSQLNNRQKGKQSLQAKTLKKLEMSLQEKDFYQAHQIVRSLVNRALTQKDYNQSIEFLNSGINELLKHNQWSSVTDLTLYLLKVYELNNSNVDNESIDQLINVIGTFPQGELTRQQIIDQIISWTNQKGNNQPGYQPFHQFLAHLYDKEGNFKLAESSYLVVSDELAPNFAKLLYNWALSTQPREFGYFLSRAVLQLLEGGQVSYAKKLTSQFIELLQSNHPELFQIDDKPTALHDGFTFCSDKLINFSQLMALLVSKPPSTDLFQQVQTEFKKDLTAFGLQDSLEKIGEHYFGVQVYRPPNLLQSLMSGLFNPGPVTGGSNMSLQGSNELD